MNSITHVAIFTQTVVYYKHGQLKLSLTSAVTAISLVSVVYN